MFNLRKYIKQILLEDAVTFEKELKTKKLLNLRLITCL